MTGHRMKGSGGAYGFDEITRIGGEIEQGRHYARAYANIVRERAMLRSLINAGNEISGSAFATDGRSASDLVDEAERRVFEIAEHGRAVTWNGTKELIGSGRWRRKIDLLCLTGFQQTTVGDDPGVLWRYPGIGGAGVYGGHGHFVFGPRFYQHPVVLVDCRNVGEGHPHREAGGFFQSSPVEF